MCKDCNKDWMKEIEDLKDVKGFHKIVKPLGAKKYEDLSGQKFHRLTAIRAVGKNSYGKILWLFECECGNKLVTELCNVRNGKITGCGCWRKEKGKNLRDLTGQKFGELTVISRAKEDYVGSDGRHRPRWNCSCSCGGTIILKTRQLVNGSVICCDNCNPHKRRTAFTYDLVGQTFGKWTVLAKSPNKSKNNHTRWICKCACGTVREVSGGHLLGGRSTSCGCSHAENTTAIDITGRKFGRWTAVEKVGKDKKNNILWRCICECGTEAVHTTHKLLSGGSLSCGCLKKEKAHARRENLIGQRFGKLVVIAKAEDHVYPSGSHRPRYKCRCDCGNEVIVMSNSLKNGSTKSCSCLQREIASKNRSIDLVGKKFGRLTVISKSERRNKKGQVIWKCLCDCGNYVEKTTSALTNNKTTLKSCGCATKERIREVCFKDLTGQRFGRLVVLRLAEPHEIKDKARGSHWFCQCDCGNTTITTVQNLHGNHTQSCGCLHRERLMEYEDLTGKKFGKLTVIKMSEKRNKANLRLWECLCDCGHTTYATSAILNSGHKVSCGCINSKGELKIANILKDNNVKFRKQMYYDNLLSESGRHLRFDFYIPEKNYLIEYDGEQHFMCTNKGWHTAEKLSKIQERDKIKDNYCRSNNIPLIRIPYTQYSNLCIDDLKLETTKFRIM